MTTRLNLMGEQTGAVEARWAHDPEVDGWTPFSAFFSHVARISVFGNGHEAVIYDLRIFRISYNQPAIAQLVERRTVVSTSGHP